MSYNNICTLMLKKNTCIGAQLMTIDQLHEMITNGALAQRTQAVRAAYKQGDKITISERGKAVEKYRYEALKDEMPLVVVQGDVTRRRKLEGFCSPSGLCCVDIDHVSQAQLEHARTKLPLLTWVKEFHTSIRGEGMHIIANMGIVPTPAAKPDENGFVPYVDAAHARDYQQAYKERYKQIANHLKDYLGVEADPSCKDVLRGIFPAHDPQAFLRPDAELTEFPYPTKSSPIAANTPIATQRASSATGTIGSMANPKLATAFLAYNQYRPSGRHSWWCKYGQHLRFKGVEVHLLPLYQQMMQSQLMEHGLVKEDDPLLRSTTEVQEAMAWGFEHSTPADTPPADILATDEWCNKFNDDEELARLKTITLPQALASSLAAQPNRVKFATLCGLMPLAQTYATKVKLRYCDGKDQRLNGMSAIVAEQGGLKSGVKDIINIWKQPLEKSDKVARQKEDEFKELRLNRKANEKLPPAPKLPVTFVTPTVSCTMLLRRLKNARGKHIFSFCEEIDTIAKTNGAGSWSAKYDIYRMAFDNGEWGQDYNSDQAESGLVQVAYNWTFMGTPQAMMRCFARNGAVENGLTGRVWHAMIPTIRFEHMPKYKELSQEQYDHILRGVDILKAAKGFVDTPKLRRAIERWCNHKADEAMENKDVVMDVFRKRAAIIGFRAGVVFMILEMGERWLADGNSLEDDFLAHVNESVHSTDFACLVADHALKYQCLLYGSQLLNDKQTIITSTASYQSRNKSLFDELDNVFTFQMLVDQRPNTKYNALRTMIFEWKKQGMITCLEKNKWQKINCETLKNC